MNNGETQMASDGQSMQVCGKFVIYTLRVGETYKPKPNHGNSHRSDVVIRGFVQAPGGALVVVDYPNGVKKRTTVAVNPKNLTQNFIVPSMPRELRRRAAPAAPDLSKDLVAQLVADMAELRARVTRLEGK